MTDFQKIVKYGALALAFMIIVSIAALVISSIGFLFNTYNKNDQTLIENKEIAIAENVTKIDIELKATNIRIESAEQFYAETNNGRIKYNVHGNTLKITESSSNIFKFNAIRDLVIYVPSDTVLDKISLEAGAGEVVLDNLTVNELDLELGAGTVKLDNVKTLQKTSIDGGAGELKITDAILNNLNLDMGVGALKLTGQLLDKSKISCGVGEVDIELLGTDYAIELDKGLGEAIIDGKSIRDEETYGTGSNKVKIDGGVGSINITFKKENNNTSF